MRKKCLSVFIVIIWVAFNGNIFASTAPDNSFLQDPLPSNETASEESLQSPSSQVTSDIEDLADAISRLQERIAQLEAAVKKIADCLKALSVSQESISQGAQDQSFAKEEADQKKSFAAKKENKIVSKVGAIGNDDNFEKAMIFLKNKNSSEAKNLLLPISKSSSSKKYGEACYWIALISLYQEKNSDEAAKYFAKACEYYEKKNEKKNGFNREDGFFYSSSLLKLAYVLKSKGNPKSAVIILKKVLSLNMDDSKDARIKKIRLLAKEMLEEIKSGE